MVNARINIAETMERNERLEAIYNEFDAAAQELCDDTGGILYEITSEYKGEEEERERTSISLHHFLRIRYRKKRGVTL